MTTELLEKANFILSNINKAKEKKHKCNRLITACGVGLKIEGTPKNSNNTIEIIINNKDMANTILSNEIAMLDLSIEALEKQLSEL